MQAMMAAESTEKAAELADEPQNRRSAPRHGVDEDARLLLIKQGSTVACRIVDLSPGGCCVRTREPFPAGSMVRVEVAFKVRGLAFRFSGVTQWTDSRNLAGIRFVDLPLRRKAELDEALCEVEEENAAKAAKEAADKQAAEQRAAARKAVPAPATPQAEQQTPRQAPAQIPAPAMAAQSAAPAQAKPTGRERREASREAVDTSAVIHLIHVASRLSGRILDLSLHGCRIRAQERFPVGIYTRVETEFHLEGLPFRLGGVVQAIHDRHTVGIRFLDMSSRKREQVQQLIEEIRGMKEAGNGE
jgi:c-di-GMP-binding flagellar brake protein YcgR